MEDVKVYGENELGNVSDIDTLVVCDPTSYFFILRDYCDTVKYRIISVHEIVHYVYLKMIRDN